VAAGSSSAIAMPPSEKNASSIAMMMNIFIVLPITPPEYRFRQRNARGDVIILLDFHLVTNNQLPDNLFVHLLTDIAAWVDDSRRQTAIPCTGV
jgi:hypothetical protein